MEKIARQFFAGTVAVIGLLAFAGCEGPQETVLAPVRLGMSRYHVRQSFGEPLRIEQVAGGGEDWYYRFASWKAVPVSSTAISADYGERTSYVSGGLQLSKDTMERPVHISSDGKVIDPLPEGRVVFSR